MRLSLFSLLPPLMFSVVLARDLRFNGVEDSVVIPSGSNDYALLQKDSKLFCAWTEHEAKGRRVVLGEADLEQWKVTELFQQVLSEGTPSAPVLMIHQGELVLAWLHKKGRGSRMRYDIELRSFPLSSKNLSKTESLAYGYQPKGFQLLSTPFGLYVGGATVPKRREAMRLLFFRKGSEEWLPLEVPEPAGSYNREPSLKACGESLHLAWVSDGKVNVTRSQNGMDWDSVQVLSGGQSSNPVLMTGETGQLGLAWVEKTAVRKMRVRSANSTDEGASWWHSTRTLDLEGSGVRFSSSFSHSSSNLLVYDYRHAAESCERIEFCIIASDLWQFRLDRFENRVCGRSLNPSVLLSDNGLYVAWQERRGRSTSLAMNYSMYPWKDWLTVPKELLTSEGDEVLVGPKLAEWDGQLFLTYFTYGAKRGPFQRNLQLGDLKLTELDENDVVSRHEIH